MLDTDLSRPPYFDDFNPNSNHYAVLFRPGVPVQTRELNGFQSILQDQIDKFGRSIYTEGSVIEGCAFSFDNRHAYVKISDGYSNGSAFTIDAFIGQTVTNQNGLQALIVDTTSGFLSQDPDLNTLYIKYLNSGTYGNGAGQSTFDSSDNLVIATTANVAVGNVAVANVANTTGLSYALSVTDGVIFKKGYFIRVPAQTKVVTKYSNLPDNISVGFAVDEEIETPEANTALYDNAAGAPNFSAPGAHRLKLVPTLVTRATNDTSNTSPFFSICDFVAGKPVTIKNDPQYSALGDQLAKRTFETNGDFVVTPFLLSTAKKVSTDPKANTYLTLLSSPGVGYPKGYRVEYLNTNSGDVRKGLDTEAISNQLVSANFGYYVFVDEFCGDFGSDQFLQIEIHSVAKQAVSTKTLLSTTRSATTKIGTAYVRGVERGSDGQYYLYLFNIQMSPGFNFSQAMSFISFQASTVKAVADVVLSFDLTSNTNIAKLQESAAATMVYPFGQKAITSNGFSGTSFEYRDKAASSFAANGSMTVTLPSPAGTGSESFAFTGTLTQESADTFIIVPTSQGLSTNNAGTVGINTSNGTVVGTGTSFTAVYQVGDFITANAVTKRIVTIANNTQLTVDSAFTSTSTGFSHQMVWPAGAPIDFSRSTRSISVSGTTATFSLGLSTTGSFNVGVYFDNIRSSTVSAKKTINRGTLVKINTANNVGGTSGPWSLGLGDVLQINHVWVSSGSYSNTGTDLANNMVLDNGQRDTHYDIANLRPKASSLAAGSLLLVSVDHFTVDESQGVGFFTANSYPIDDANTANTSAIQTAQIPLFTSQFTGTTYDLRDSVDFRPYAANTAAITSTIGSATVNPTSLVGFHVPTNGSYLPSPNKVFETNLVHYLPRKDRVVLDTDGQLRVVEGIAGLNPQAPKEPVGTMTLGIVNVAQYPSLSPSDAKVFGRYDYAVSVDLVQTKRYTMANIGALDDRISNLEYYVSLSLLEKSTDDLQIRSGTTGQNRFKNGILVDPFRGHDIGNTLDPQYRIAIDPTRTEARPVFRQFSSFLKLNTSLSTGVVRTGSIVTLTHNDNLFQQQAFASSFRNCIEGNIYQFKSQCYLSPAGDTYPDTTVAPDVNANPDLESNFVNQDPTNAWGMSWGSWVTEAQTSDSSAPEASYNSATVTTTQNLSITDPSQLDLGSYVTNVSIVPYVRARTIFFAAQGMKPNTRVWAFFNGTPVTGYCRQLANYTGAVYTADSHFVTSTGAQLLALQDGSGNNVFFTIEGTWGASLTTDANGVLFGQFSIPAGVFKSGQIEFELADVSDLTQGMNAISTMSTGIYAATGLAVQNGRTVLNTRDVVPQVQELIDDSVIQQIEIHMPPPQVIPPPVINNYITNPVTYVYVQQAPTYQTFDYTSNADGGF